jgi:hypothetical protein
MERTWDIRMGVKHEEGPSTGRKGRSGWDERSERRVFGVLPLRYDVGVVVAVEEEAVM